MAAYVGSWVFGDTLKALQVTIKTLANAAFDLTGYTVTLEGHLPGEQAITLTKAGTVTDAAGGVCTFVGFTTGLQPANAGERDRYLCLIKLVSGGTTTYAGLGPEGEPFALSIARWP